MNVLIAGQKWFGAEIFRALKAISGVNILAVCAPINVGDRLANQAILHGVHIIPSGTLNAETMPKNIDLIIAAHSHDFIGEKTRQRSKWGGIGYHPSLLPMHRGRDSVEWVIRMGEKVTGGTVYRLSNKIDGGEILAQEHVFVRRGDNSRELWERDLAPLGVKLLSKVVSDFVNLGYQYGAEQDDELSTWEPSIGRPPAFRPDLLMIEKKVKK